MPALTHPPRVVSLLPSATELLCAAGGAKFLVGRSHECDFPASITHLPVLTRARTHPLLTTDLLNPAPLTPAQIDAQVRAALGDPAGPQSLYELFTDRLAALRPDVILTQDLCEVCSIDLATVRAVAQTLPHPPEIVSLNPATVEGVLDDLMRVAQSIGTEPETRGTVAQLRERLFAAGEFVNAFDDGPVLAFLEWTDPLFCAGHWTVQLIERAGARHPFNPTRPKDDAGAAVGPQSGERRAGSLRMSEELLIAAKPQRLIICPCGVDLATTRVQTAQLAERSWWNDLPAVRTGHVALVDGNQMFNRPGPRLVDAYEWLVGWLHDRPELVPASFPWERWSPS
jgi:iron complex transport system substrate-binding protein